MRDNSFSFEWINLARNRKSLLLKLKSSKNQIEDPKKRTVERIRIMNLSDVEVIKELRELKK
ncbi:MAG: hypothetical protein GY909_15710 [Oligoflexia bacterium]|nr:hypothetical protein [Oligoflexia bacterium]